MGPGTANPLFPLLRWVIYFIYDSPTILRLYVILLANRSKFVSKDLGLEVKITVKGIIETTGEI